MPSPKTVKVLVLPRRNFAIPEGSPDGPPGHHLPGSIITVSASRAKFLTSEGACKYGPIGVQVASAAEGMKLYKKERLAFFMKEAGRRKGDAMPSDAQLAAVYGGPED